MIERFEAAKRLAHAHYVLEPGITCIFTIRDKPEIEASPSAPIKLLEVNADTSPSGVMPLYFGPAPNIGVPYPSVIVEVTPAEFDELRSATLRLPEGWSIGDELPKPSANGVSL